MLCTNASAVGMSFISAARPASVLRSSATERLLRLLLAKMPLTMPAMTGATNRMLSPSGGSILMISAPKSPRICVA